MKQICINITTMYIVHDLKDLRFKSVLLVPFTSFQKEHDVVPENFLHKCFHYVWPDKCIVDDHIISSYDLFTICMLFQIFK